MILLNVYREGRSVSILGSAQTVLGGQAISYRMGSRDYFSACNKDWRYPVTLISSLKF
jgi:hypothetical protein